MVNANISANLVATVKIHWSSPRKSTTIKLIFIGITLAQLPKEVDKHITMYYSTCDWHNIFSMSENTFEIYHEGKLIT
jgi:hypothetical protein